MKKSTDIGLIGEKKACEYLVDMGYEIINTRYRAKGGEIDIIAKQGDVICFIEVKYRPDARLGEAFSSVDEDKRRRVRSAARQYILDNNIKCKQRFDIIEITRAHMAYEGRKSMKINKKHG